MDSPPEEKALTSQSNVVLAKLFNMAQNGAKLTPGCTWTTCSSRCSLAIASINLALADLLVAYEACGINGEACAIAEDVLTR